MDFIFNFYTELYDELKKCPENITKMISNEIKFIIFLHNPTSFNETARKENPPVLFLRRDYTIHLKSIRYFDDFLICYID